jgi:purine-binding chemotaxis protein CheW
MHDASGMRRIDWNRVRERLASHEALLERQAADPAQRNRILRERAAKLAAGSDAQQRGAALHVVVFLRGGIRYGIDLARLQEIQPCHAITRLPSVPPFCAGIANLRGEILPVFDLPRLFSGNGSEEPLQAPQRIVVADSDTARIGIAADEVDDAMALAPEEIEPPLVTFSGPRARLILGLARGALLLDCKTLIDSDALVVG